jgi:hypothetical protein
MLLAIFSPTFSVDLVAVPFPPVTRRLPVTLPATRTDAEMHPPVTRELLERQQVTALRAELLAFHALPLPSQPGRHHAPTFFLPESFARGSVFREDLKRGLETSRFSTDPPPGHVFRDGRIVVSALQRHFQRRYFVGVVLVVVPGSGVGLGVT